MSDLRGCHLYLDCFSGIAGDMLLGALIDLGVPEAVIRDALGKIPVGEHRLEVGRTERSGISTCNVTVRIPHQGHGHRAWSDIRAFLSPGRALSIFEKLAAAEAKVHGVSVDDVEFHEVGAVDSIVDIVGVGVSLEWLAPSRITCRRVPLGHGTTKSAHGQLPVPPPAVMELLRDCEVEDGGVPMELTTPTGAAIVKACSDGFGPIPSGRPIAVGYGAGDREIPGRPNVLRVVALQTTSSVGRVFVLEANVDDMNPELCEHVAEAMVAAGARDVWYSTIVMKKGRPALQVGALCDEADRDGVADALLRESTTIGLRWWPADRRVLEREEIRVATPFGEILVKVCRDGDRVVNAAPEYESCRRAARERNIPLKDVYAAAQAAYREVH